MCELLLQTDHNTKL